jgi:hypothetical protein
MAAAIVARLAPVAEFKRVWEEVPRLAVGEIGEGVPTYVELRQVLSRSRCSKLANARCFHISGAVVLPLAILSEKGRPKRIGKCLDMSGIAMDDSLAWDVSTNRPAIKFHLPRGAHAKTKVGRPGLMRSRPV